MPTPIPAGMRLGVIEPADAVAVFRQRKLLSVSYNWQDVWQEEHARAFTVSRLTSIDLLGQIRAELDRALAEGRSLKQFVDEIRPALQKAGWWGTTRVTDPDSGETGRTTFDARRLQLIFDTNLRQSYAAGRWARIERNRAVNPYVIYRTMRDERVRASHRPWDGVVLPVDDPFWDTHYPPNGWRCRCLAYAIDAAGVEELRAAGVQIKTAAPPERLVPYVNRRTAQTTLVPHGIDPGFAYNAGKARALADAQIAAAKASAWLTPEQAAPVLSALMAGPREQAAYEAWVDSVFAARAAGARGRVTVLGFVDPVEQRYLQAQGREVALAPIQLRDGLLIGPKGRRHEAAGNALTPDEWKRARQMVARPAATLYDSQTGAVLYVGDADDGRAVKLIVQTNYVLRGGLTNDVRAAYKVGADKLRADIAHGRYRVIRGEVW